MVMETFSSSSRCGDERYSRLRDQGGRGESVAKDSHGNARRRCRGDFGSGVSQPRGTVPLVISIAAGSLIAVKATLGDAD